MSGAIDAANCGTVFHFAPQNMKNL